MDKFDRQRGVDNNNNNNRYISSSGGSSEEPNNNNNNPYNSRHPRGGGAPFHHRRNSPNNYRGVGRENHRPFDSPPPYPPPGGDGAGGGELRGIGGFRPMSGGGRGFRPMGGGDGIQLVGGDGGSDGGGFRPMGGGRGFQQMDGGVDSYHMPPPAPLTGQKRGYPFSAATERSPGREGASFAKLFVGSVPRTATEDDIRPLFDKHGRVMEVALIKDKRTGQQQGCCFIKYASSEEADRAIRELHNQYTLPGGVGPIQVRYADGERERLGATEYKLFVGSLNKQATEKEVEEIFSPYGRVEDVYLMRDEMKQSRGCGFVKYSQREMAQAAINALNGTYTMRGCDQPLTVRFADPKRPRPGESRGVPSFGGPGFGPRFPGPGIRLPSDRGELLHGPIPPNSWPPMSPQNLRPQSHVGNHGFGNQFPARSGDMADSSTPYPFGGPGNADGPFPGPNVSSTPTSQLNFNQPLPQVPSFASKVSPTQRPLQSPQHLQSSVQLQPLNGAPFSNVQSLQGSHMQPGQMQIPHSAGQAPYSQVQSTQQLQERNGPPNQMQHNASFRGQAPGMGNQQPLSQSPFQLAQMLSQQKQTLQATFQSSQQALNQLQQQLHQLQPSNQNLPALQGSLAAKQQSPWAGTLSQPVASTPGVPSGGDLATTTAASPNVPAVARATATITCNWTEHMSPDGYKYYYNSSTGESKWEKPEELILYEQQQPKPSNQHPQAQPHPTGPSTQQVPQMQVQLQGPHQAQLHNQTKPLQQASLSTQQAPQMQVQLQGPHQAQLHNQTKALQQASISSYQVPGFSAKHGTKELGYAQIPAGAGPVNDSARYQQASQEWMWKNKHPGT